MEADVRMIIGGFSSLALITALAMLADAQNKTGGAKNSSTVATGAAAHRDAPLVFTEAIPLENAKGRFDPIVRTSRRARRLKK